MQSPLFVDGVDQVDQVAPSPLAAVPPKLYRLAIRWKGERDEVVIFESMDRCAAYVANVLGMVADVDSVGVLESVGGTDWRPVMDGDRTTMRKWAIDLLHAR